MGINYPSIVLPTNYPYHETLSTSLSFYINVNGQVLFKRSTEIGN